MKANVKKGERVRIIVEGIVTRADDSTFRLESENSHVVTLHNSDVEYIVGVERIPEPRIQFKPGDVVRSKDCPEYTYTLATTGYVDNHNGVFNAGPSLITQFHSGHYELVEFK